MQSPGEVSTEQQLVTCSPPAAQETSFVGPREQYTESNQKREWASASYTGKRSWQGKVKLVNTSKHSSF